MIEIDWKPHETTLRQFGWICLPGFGLVGTVVAWRLGCFEGSGSWTASLVLWGLAVICPIVGMLAPRALKYLFIGMMVLAFPIGLVVGTLVLLLLFFLLFTPIALWFKLIKRDEMKRRLSPEAETYWIPVEETRSPESYYRQF
jgi:hypothetical protein